MTFNVSYIGDSMIAMKNRLPMSLLLKIRRMNSMKNGLYLIVQLLGCMLGWPRNVKSAIKKTLEYVAKMASATLLATGGPKPSSMTLSRFARSVLIGILQYIQSTPTTRDMHGLEVGLTPLQMQWMPTSSTIHSKCPAESYKVAGLASPW